MTFTLPRRSLLLAAAGSAAATFAPALRAQAWPNRPLRFVVPFARAAAPRSLPAPPQAS
jgi:hypothetical protein